MTGTSDAHLPKIKPRSQIWYGISVVALFSCFLNLLILVSPIYSLQLFDRVLPSRSISTLVYLTIFALTAVMALGALDALRTRALSRIAGWWDEVNRPKVLTASVLATLQAGTPVANGLQDLQTVRQFMTSSAPLPLFDAPWVPFFVFVLFILHPYLGLLALITAIILFVLAVLNDIVARRSMKGVSQAQLQLNSAAMRAIRNADTIQAMGMHAALSSRYLAYNRVIQDAMLLTGDRGSIISGTAKFVRIAAQMGVMGTGAWLVLQSQMTPGAMIAGSILLGRALAPVEQAIGAWRSLIAARESFGRLQGLIELADSQEEVMALMPPQGRFSVERLTYLPSNSDKPIIRDMSFSLEPGSAMAVIGPSAAGKSTLCRLLIGSLKASAGNVRLDGADLYRWNREDVGNYVGYLSQGVELFGGTVKENIARLGEIDEAAVSEAAVMAGCHDMVLELPAGYETDVGDAGAYLSGGQRQRIGLARAIYRKPRLIVLDEPDAHLDDIGLDALVRAIHQLRRQGSTIVVVTHRQALIRPCNKMMVVSAGAIELFGDTKDVVGAIRQKQSAAKGKGQRSEPALRQMTEPQAG